jgi:hypothetical protein
MSALAAFCAWAISQEVTGALQWLGTIIAVVGIPLTYRQSWKAANAAEEAARAVRTFQSRSKTANVAHSQSYLQLARGFVSSENFQAAESVVGILKRDVLQTISFLETEADPPENLAVARRNISRIEAQISKAGRKDDFKPAILDRAMNGLSDCLIEWENRFVTSSGQ